MKSYSRSHLSDQSLLCDLVTRVSQHRALTAELLADIAEVDARRLYVPAGYPSMFAYCVQELRLGEQAAFYRIRAARAARQYPAIFAAVANGNLHLSAIVLLAPHLTPENADELLRAAIGKSKSEIEQLTAERFPRPDVPARVQALTSPLPPGQAPEQLSPGIVDLLTSGPAGSPPEQVSPGMVEPPAPRPKLAPLAPQRFALQCTVGQETHDKLRYAQELLSHEIPSGDVANVLDRVLEIAIGQLEKRKFAACSKPRPPQGRTSTNPRHIPAHVKRAVWQRDGGRCTFVSETGHRCSARTRLEFDHLDPVARGGRATVNRIRLRCRAHNQYSAECVFGTEFMAHKRDEARRATSEARARAAAKKQAEQQSRERARAAAEEVVPWLRQLGIRADEARRAAARCESIPDAPLEQRVRHALRCFGPRTSSRICLEATPTESAPARLSAPATPGCESRPSRG